MTQEQIAHLDELIQLMREECDFGIVEAFKQGIKFGVTLMEEIHS